jgi:hypothetical protein
MNYELWNTQGGCAGILNYELEDSGAQRDEHNLIVRVGPQERKSDEKWQALSNQGSSNTLPPYL